MCISPRKWLRAFTLKETIYTVVEAILLLFLILFLVYLILHLSVCSPTQRSNQKQCGRYKVNATVSEAQELGNGTRAQFTTIQQRSNSGNFINVTSIITNDTTTREGEDANDFTQNTTTKAGLGVNNTLIVTSEVVSGTIASINESNNSRRNRSRRMIAVKTVKIETASTVSTESKESVSREPRNNQPDSAEEILAFVEYSEEEAGPNDTLTPKVKHCEKCAQAQREHESGKCDCGACASNRTVLLKLQSAAFSPAGAPPQSVSSLPAGSPQPGGSASLTGAPPTVGGASPSGASPPSGGLRRFTVVESKFTDDDAASELHKELVLALVKAEPDDTFTYVCVVVIVAEFWSLGAALCISELRADTLGLYFLVERFGETAMGESHGVVEAARGGEAGEALALRAAGSLLARGGRPARLADPLDHLLLVLGDTFTALGYGHFRSIQARNEDLRLRQTCINLVAQEACGGGAGGGRLALCAGVLFGAAAPCYFCAGTPLVRGGALLALADARCGPRCAARRYVPAAALGDWLRALLAADAARPPDYRYDDY